MGKPLLGRAAAACPVSELPRRRAGGRGPLIERLLTDPAFRARFRRDPAAVCREAGLDELADEMTRAPGAAMMTLDVRESRSSLAGVVMAAAMEGVGVYEFTRTSCRASRTRARAIGGVLSQVDLPAVKDVARGARRRGGGAAGAARGRSGPTGGRWRRGWPRARRRAAGGPAPPAPGRRARGRRRARRRPQAEARAELRRTRAGGGGRCAGGADRAEAPAAGRPAAVAGAADRRARGRSREAGAAPTPARPPTRRTRRRAAAVARTRRRRAPRRRPTPTSTARRARAAP